MIKGKEYSYQNRKKQININMSKRVLEEMDKERLKIRFEDVCFGDIMTRSEFVQHAVIKYIMELRKLKEKISPHTIKEDVSKEEEK